MSVEAISSKSHFMAHRVHRHQQILAWIIVPYRSNSNNQAAPSFSRCYGHPWAQQEEAAAWLVSGQALAYMRPLQQFLTNIKACNKGAGQGWLPGLLACLSSVITLHHWLG